MGGGPSPAQNAAAASSANLSNQEGAAMQTGENRATAAYNQINPYATSRLNNGLPFYAGMQDYAGGPSATAYAPAKAAVMRRYGSMGSAAPSGSEQQNLTNVDASRANAFDSSLVNNQMLNETAKNNAAAMITGQQQLANPLGWAGAQSGTNSSIMNAPLATQGLSGLYGGLAGGAMSAIPF